MPRHARERDIGGEEAPKKAPGPTGVAGRGRSRSGAGTDADGGGGHLSRRGCGAARPCPAACEACQLEAGAPTHASPKLLLRRMSAGSWRDGALPAGSWRCRACAPGDGAEAAAPQPVILSDRSAERRGGSRRISSELRPPARPRLRSRSRSRSRSRWWRSRPAKAAGPAAGPGSGSARIRVAEGCRAAAPPRALRPAGPGLPSPPDPAARRSSPDLPVLPRRVVRVDGTVSQQRRDGGMIARRCKYMIVVGWMSRRDQV